MPGNEADRIARQRVKQQNQEYEQAQLVQRQARIARVQSYVGDIEAEVPIVLRLLAERGYPGVEEVSLTDNPHPIKRLFGTHSKGGWKIGTYTYTLYGEDVAGDVFLLSDGRFAFGRGRNARSLRDDLKDWIDSVARYRALLPSLHLSRAVKIPTDLSWRGFVGFEANWKPDDWMGV